MTGCYLAQFAEDNCSGMPDDHHLIRQQDIRKEHSLANPRTPTAWHKPNGLTGTDLDSLLADPRILVRVCRSHHARLHAGLLECEVPESAKEWAVEYGLERYLP